MMEFFEQLASQSGVMVAGEKPPVEEVVDLAGEADLMEVEIYEESVPPQVAREIEVVETREEVMVPEEVVVPEEVAAEVKRDVLEVSVPLEMEVPLESEEPRGELPSEEIGRVNEVRDSLEKENEVPGLPDATSTSANTLEAVFSWIGEGEQERVAEADAVVFSEKVIERETTEGELLPEVESPMAREREEVEKSPDPVMPMQVVSRETPELHSPFAPELVKHEKPETQQDAVTQISIGSILVTVDAGSAPVPIKRAMPTPPPAPSKPSSSRTQLRRHYLIPH